MKTQKTSQRKAKNKNFKYKNKKKNSPRKSQSRSGKRKKSLSLNEVILKYQNLMDQHIMARKKLFELFFRKDPRRIEKLKRNFERTGQDIRNFERQLSPEFKKVLETRTEGYPLDLDYSASSDEKRETPPTSDPESQLYHISEVQKERPSYAEDREESRGTMDDYLKYKELA